MYLTKIFLYDIILLKMIRLLITLFLSITTANAEIKIAIFDTGLDLNDVRFTGVLCKSGHRDFTGEGIEDQIGHGTHVVGLIKQYAGNSKYCLLIYKYYSEKRLQQNFRNLFLSYMAAVDEQVDFVNFSGGGPSAIMEEAFMIGNNPNITFVVAAGNEGSDLVVKPYYPAMYGFKNVVAVGNLNKEGKRHPSSNYGKVGMSWEIGTDIISTCLNNTNCKLTGTSMSTAIKTGKLIKQKYLEDYAKASSFPK